MFELLILLFLPHTLNFSSPDQIFTTYRDDGNNTVWDGKWTFLQEWKRTSFVSSYDENFVVRVGHDYKNMYVFLDLLSQNKFSKHSDYSVICITTNTKPRDQIGYDDRCFFITLGSQSPLTFTGGGTLAVSNYLTKINTDPDLIAVGNVSDINDRYTTVPHSSYEFKIPLNEIGRNDTYRFYASAYDTSENKIYNWPEITSEKTFPNIPPPSGWGYIISPDESLPEFPLVSLILVFSFCIIMYFSRKNLVNFNCA